MFVYIAQYSVSYGGDEFISVRHTLEGAKKSCSTHYRDIGYEDKDGFENLEWYTGEGYVDMWFSDPPIYLSYFIIKVEVEP
ncbi:hypothetical protein LCGC14_3024250 [marine sediment metagenome]|uniref:Uncharacterized protein n=1 Tax=marine sediment metagenome TaxID=412755 RepID=A0A0F8XHI2_9ZZZZ